MPVDNWMILAYVMIFSSIILCGLLPMILRLYNARQHFYHYRDDDDDKDTGDSTRRRPSALKSNYNNIQLKVTDVNFERLDSSKELILYTQIPFIDDDANS